MTAKLQEKQHKDQEQQQCTQRSAAIGQHVMHGLGRPGDLRRVLVRHLWEDRYRVNILVGDDVTSEKVAHSYFLVADSDGNIVASTPMITKQYECGTEGR